MEIHVLISAQLVFHWCLYNKTQDYTGRNLKLARAKGWSTNEKITKSTKSLIINCYIVTQSRFKSRGNKCFGKLQNCVALKSGLVTETHFVSIPHGDQNPSAVKIPPQHLNEIFHIALLTCMQWPIPEISSSLAPGGIGGKFRMFTTQRPSQ